MNKPNTRKIYFSTFNTHIDRREDIKETTKEGYKRSVRTKIPDITIEAMEEYGKQMFNYALELAAENARIITVPPTEGRSYVDPDNWREVVDKESIIKLKIP